MANTFKYVDWLSAETLRQLLNRLEVAQFFNTEYEKDFNKDFAIGDTLRVKFPQRFTVREGLVYNPQNISRLNTTVVVDQIIGVDFEWDSAEAALKVERGRDKIKAEYLEPAGKQLAQEIDSRAANWVRKHASKIVGVLGTDPSSFKDISGKARQKMIEAAGWFGAAGDRGMVIPPRVNTELVSAAAAYFNPSSDISKQYKEGSIGRQGGFDWYESMSLYSHTAGTWAGAVTCTGASADGDTTLAVTCTTGDTFKEGDTFTIADIYEVNPSTRRSTGSLQQFVVRADATGAGSAASLTIAPTIYGPNHQYQNVSALPTASKALTLFPGTTSPSGKSGIVGCAMNRNAFALVGVKLELPKAVEMASYATDPDTGISVRFVRAWDQNLSKMTNRFDVLFGFGDLYAHNCAVKVLSA